MNDRFHYILKYIKTGSREKYDLQDIAGLLQIDNKSLVWLFDKMEGASLLPDKKYLYKKNDIINWLESLIYKYPHFTSSKDDVIHALIDRERVLSIIN